MSASVRIRRHRRSWAARTALRLSLLLAGLGLGCGVLTVIPIDELRVGNPAGRQFDWSHEPYRSGEVIFSHEPHSFVECASCHPGGSRPEEVRQSGLPSMARCLQCHDGKGGGASNACETCHQIERVGRKPSSHGASWQRDHGKDAEEQAYQCALCHAESECQGCHATRKPQSHTLRFLRSTHGRRSIHERAACATCHDADFCENCHSQPPRDHTPTFMTTGGHKQVARLNARSCLNCHRFQEDCSRCHGG